MILSGSKDRKNCSGYAVLEEFRPNFHKRHTIFYSKTKPDYTKLMDLMRVNAIRK